MAERALQNQGSYICAINLFWLDFMRSSTPGVPLNRQQVLALAGHVFGDGVAAPPPFVKRLLECQSPHVVVPMPAMPSGLVMISPDEFCHCILAAPSSSQSRKIVGPPFYALCLVAFPTCLQKSYGFKAGTTGMKFVKSSRASAELPYKLQWKWPC